MIKTIPAFAAAALIAGCSTVAPAGGGAAAPGRGERIVIIIKAKPGTEKALFDNTIKWMAEVRKVPGLVRTDINQAKNDPATMVLYYHWRSAEDGEAYRKSDLYKRATEALEPYIAQRTYIPTINLD